MAANGFSEAFPRSCASWLDWISNMSLIAASFTKSAVVGATPRTEFTPVFSPTDCASAGVAKRIRAKLEARYFMVRTFPVWVSIPNQVINFRCFQSFPAAGLAKISLEGFGRIFRVTVERTCSSHKGRLHVPQ